MTPTLDCQCPYGCNSVSAGDTEAAEGTRPVHGYRRGTQTSGRLSVSKWSWVLVERAGTRSRVLGEEELSHFCAHAVRNAKPPGLPKEVQAVSERPPWESSWYCEHLKPRSLATVTTG